MYICECVCVCVCVSLTQLNYKKVNDGNVLLSWITYLNVFLFVIRNSRFLWDWKKSHSQCILKKLMSARLIHSFFFFFFFAFHSCWWIRRTPHWRENVYPLRRICVKRGRMFVDDVFIENTCLGNGSKRRTKFTCGRSFTHVTWFYWPMVSGDWICVRASAIFVVRTNGIPPNLSYRSVKSYTDYVFRFEDWLIFIILSWVITFKHTFLCLLIRVSVFRVVGGHVIW